MDRRAQRRGVSTCRDRCVYPHMIRSPRIPVRFTIATTGHVVALASAADCAKMEVREPAGAAQRPPRDSALGRAHGGGESDVGLHADPRRLKNVGHRVGRSTIWRILKAAGLPPVPAADLMADVLERALRPHRWGRFLHDRSLNLSGSRHVLHRLHHRSRVPPRADPRIHTASGGAVHAADRLDA